MKKRSTIFFLAFLFCAIAQNLEAQQDTTFKKLFSLTAEDVLNSPPPKQEERVSVASFQQTSLRSSPSVITLITQSEIQQSGARGIVDVLRLVAGLDFAQNFDMVMGLGVRGNWAEEGKFLFLLDGQTLNESAFGTLIFYMRIPVFDIERIEIMRGAGSALYGGLASLCVINVITKHKTSGNSTTVSSQGGISVGGMSRSSLHAQITQQLKAETSLSFAAHVAQGNNSNRTINVPTGTLINFKDSSRVDAQNIRINLRHRALQANFSWHKYSFTAIPEVATLAPRDLKGTMHDILFGITAPFQLSTKWSLQPRLQWKTQRPWWYENYQNLAGRTTYDRYRTLNHRFTTGLIARYTPKNWYSLTLGSEFFWDHARYFLPNYTFFNQKNNINFTNVAFFTESVFTTRIANLTIGGRADKNSAYQWAFTPRIALTKIWKNLHGKALLNYAFKAPTIQNIQYGYNKNMRPEWVRTIEFEMGYTWQNKFTLTTNFFDTRIDGPIVYVFIPATLEEYYENKTRSGTRGIEIETKWKSEKVFIRANHSFYTNNKTDVAEYLVGEHAKVLAGFPAHKTTLQANYIPNKNLTLGITCLAFSEKFTYSYFGTGFTDYRLNRLPATYSLNAHIQWKLPIQGFELGLSLFNITNQVLWVISPTNSAVTPFPEQGREFVCRLVYKLGE